MIYSILAKKYVPVDVQHYSYNVEGFGNFTKYMIKDDKIPIGFVDIRDTPTGIDVEFIKKQNPNYKNFTDIAYQIQVEHCLKRNMDTFEIKSEAALNSHSIHYRLGKRFLSEKINNLVENIIKKTPKGEICHTEILGAVPMYMPQNLIKKYIEIIKKSPLIK